MKIASQIRPDKRIRRILAKSGPGVARTHELLKLAISTTLSSVPWFMATWDAAGHVSSECPLPTGCPDGVITVTLVDDDEIKDLNSRYLGHEDPTDVIAFPYYQPEPDVLNIKRGPLECDEPFGDIVISVDTALSQSQEYGGTLEAELVLLAVHGTLHLMGYDDTDSEKEPLMRNAEEKILKELEYD